MYLSRYTYYKGNHNQWTAIIIRRAWSSVSLNNLCFKILNKFLKSIKHVKLLKKFLRLRTDKWWSGLLPNVQQGNLGKKRDFHVLSINVQARSFTDLNQTFNIWLVLFDWYKSLKKTKIIVIFFFLFLNMAWSTYCKVYINPMHLHMILWFLQIFFRSLDIYYL